MFTIDPGQDEERASDASTAPRLIQSSGFLLALSDDWIVECASANVATFLGLQPGDLIGTAASTFLSEDTIHSLRNRLALLRDPDGIERLFACPFGTAGDAHDVAIHVAGDQVIVESEPSAAKHYGDVTGTLRGMVKRLDDADDLPGLCSAGARQMRALTGFDRVMVTRFEDDGSGVIIAESARAASDSLVGARLPATAVDPAERAAFRRSPLHVTADVDAAPVAIITDPSSFGHAPDLTRAVLRLASPGQLDQLRSMGAQASVAIALEVDDALWGLITCHHHAARRVSFERRSLAELFAQMFAMRIEILQLRTLAGRS